MAFPTWDLHALRSFVIGVEMGNLTKAAARVGLSVSAVSAQLKRLEEMAGVPVLQRRGRGMVLTPAGETLLGHARRMLQLNDEAGASLKSGMLTGHVRIGLQEDFGEGLLTQMLGEFARSHPTTRIEAYVGRNSRLLERIETGELDLALAWDSGRVLPHAENLGRLPLRWIGKKGRVHRVPRRGSGVPLSLVALEAPCLMRSAATSALDGAGIDWHLAFSGTSLAATWAAVEAGLGITVRTAAGMPTRLTAIAGLPRLPILGIVLHRAEARQTEAANRLRDIVKQRVAALLGGAPRGA